MSTVELEITGKETSLETAVKQATKQLKDLDQQAEKTGQKSGPPASAAKGWQDLGVAVGGAFAAMKAADVIGDVIGEASDLEQSVGGVDAVFKDSADTIHQWAQNAASSLGISQNAANEFAAVLGAQLKNAGTPLDQVAGKVQNLVGLGADLAATYGGTTADAVTALSSALKGEMDPIEKYGISLNASALQAKAASMGIDGAVASWDTATKQQVILAAITDQSTDALGQFEKQSDSTAEKQQIANAKWEDAKAKLGEALLPAVNKVTDGLGKMADFVARNKDWIIPLVTVLGTLGGVLLAIVEAVKIWTVVQWALNIAMDANPIGLIIIAVAALIAIIVLIATKTTWFQDLWRVVWDGIKTAAKAVADFFVDTVWHDGIEKAFNWIADKAETVFNFFKELPGKIGGWLSGIADTITGAFKGAFNWVTDQFNKIIHGINTGIRGFNAINPFADIPTIPDLPKFHSGGTIPGPVGTEVPIMALAGEHIDPIGAPTGGDRPIVLQVNANDTATGRFIASLLQMYVRANGGSVQVALGNGRG